MIISNVRGAVAEDVAEKYLKKQKYKILERNFKCPFGEIDIIAKDKDTIVFVEVKYKSGSFLGFPRENITKSKLQKIKITAQSYLKKCNLYGSKCRFDAIEILESQIEHIKNILD